MSNQNESGRLNGQNVAASDQDRSASGGGGPETTVQASQTLPLITEELAATHARNTQSTPTTTSHVTTPVMPPNPIRREEQPVPARSATRMMQENTTAVGESTDVVENAKGDVGEKKEKSESRVSATQLVAGAAAAATSSVIGGQLGVAGTVVGAGVASIITGLAVTLYTSSLDKGKEKIKEVGTKLAPAVKAKSIGAKTQRSSAVSSTGPSRTTSTFGSLSDEADFATTVDAPSAQHPSPDTTDAANDEPKSWWQKLRRKRVLYPVAIGVATFGIGLGAVVMAESFTAADISPGTSQISRSVTGDSGTGDDSETSHDGGGTAESSSSGDDSQPGQNPNQGSGTESSTTSEGQSTSANEGSSTTSSTADQTGTDQGTDVSSTTTTGDETAGAASDSSGSSSAEADTSGGGTTSTDGSSSSGSQGGAGSSGSGSSSGGSSSGGGSGDGVGSGSGSSSAGGGSTATAEG
ncbi:hypothetical protein [Brevibacterium aurantiacum]|uniref:Uncharacterized protein n=1 Tax=Brevibacterium aurantiacum TaxID=273384 RepID=A0A556CHX6_BREAU|nr:hypothetical protein [Brevibacterium aurantiacum]TSI17040.1 hypothetical protein FO013_09565 [Brevibacterium aurantiacum]